MYKKIVPRKHLQPFIEGIWIQESADVSNLTSYRPTRVLPTASVEATFFYADPFVEVSEHETILLPRCLITGQKTRFKEYLATGKTGIIIVRFTPWGARPFFHLPLHELIDANLDLSLVAPPQIVARLEDQLQGSTSLSQKICLIQDFLDDLFIEKYTDELTIGSAHEIARLNGSPLISHVAQTFNLSTRQLERRFKYAIGISPKKFASIIRFQKAIGHQNWDEALKDCNFFDQAHFIKTFKSFAGLTPTKLYAQKKPTQLAAFFNSSQDMSLFYNTIYL
jgi:AraC-like DNA-binding protein